jgi:hypothetical protein
MTGKEAEQTLGVIRTLMERRTLYRNLSGHAGMVAGAVTLVGSLLREWLHTPFLPTWLGVLCIACGASVYFTAGMATENREPFWTRQARTIVLALLPAFMAAAVLTLVMIRLKLESMLPGIWMLLWGVGALAMGFFTPRVIWMLGATFMVAGTAALVIEPLPDSLSMGLTFGAIHFVYGFVLIVIRPREVSGQPGLHDV